MAFAAVFRGDRGGGLVEEAGGGWEAFGVAVCPDDLGDGFGGGGFSVVGEGGGEFEVGGPVGPVAAWVFGADSSHEWFHPFRDIHPPSVGVGLRRFARDGSVTV